MKHFNSQFKQEGADIIKTAEMLGWVCIIGSVVLTILTIIVI